MRVLAFDTTGERLTIALFDGGKVYSRAARPVADQDDQLPGEAEKLLKSRKLKLSDIDAFVAPSGPGRFTGIRVGLTFAAVLSKALKKPAVGVSWLEAGAWRSGAPAATLVVAIVQGWKGEFFFQVFRTGPGGPKPVQPPRWSDPVGLNKAIEHDLGGGEKTLVGPAAVEALKHLPGHAVAEAGGEALSAVDLLAPALAKLALGEAAQPEPLYIKPPHYER